MSRGTTGSLVALIISVCLFPAATRLSRADSEIRLPVWSIDELMGAVWGMNASSGQLHVFIHNNDVFLLQTFDAATGGILNEVELGTKVAGGPLFQDKLLYFAEHPGRIIAMDLASGKPVWNTEPGDVPTTEGSIRIIAAGENLLILGRTLYGKDAKAWLQIRDAEKGQLIWKIEPGKFPGSQIPFAGNLADLQGRLCAVGTKEANVGEISVYDIVENKLLWSKAAKDLPNGKLLAMSFLGRVLCVYGWTSDQRGWLFLWDGPSGRLLWKIDPGGLPGWIQHSLAAQNNIILAGRHCSKNDLWIAVHDRETGREIWKDTITDARAGGVSFFSPDETVISFLASGSKGWVESRDVRSGSIVWKAQLDNACRFGYDRLNKIITRDVLLVADGPSLRCIHCSTGKTLWTTKASQDSQLDALHVDRNRVYVAGDTYLLTKAQKMLARINPRIAEGRREYWLQCFELSD